MTAYETMAFFLIYAFLGWCVEVIYSVVKKGYIINRGYLNGPVCPIYGFGMLAVLETMLSLVEHKFLLFLVGMLFSTVIELIGGWALYHFFHQRWWDYTREPFNLGGFICVRFTIFWGMGVVLVMDILHPPVSRLVHTLPHSVGLPLMVVFSVVFVVDCVVTTNTVLKMKRDLEHLEKLAASMREMSDAMAQRIGNRTLSVEQRIDESRVQAALGRAELRDRMEEIHEDLEDRMDDLKQRHEEFHENMEDRMDDLKQRHEEFHENLEDRMDDLKQRHEEIQNRLTRGKWVGSGRILRAFPHLKDHFHIKD